MSDIGSAVTELSAALQKTALPGDFARRYDLLECLSHHLGRETFLAKQKGSNALCVVKCYDTTIYPTVNEGRILKSLRHEGLPAFLDEYRSGAEVCVVREYIEGTPLDRYMAGHTLTEAWIVRLCVRLCDILIYLHGLTPPVIHRDIKPQNVVVGGNGEVSLIDFDIARTYDEKAQADTQLAVTRAYAPPEQYGFSQTDRRADIYSLGILLCYMLTGDTDVKKAEIKNKKLAAVVAPLRGFLAGGTIPGCGGREEGAAQHQWTE